MAEFLRAELGAQGGLTPGSSVEGDRSVIDITFTDGSRVHMHYPADWPLDEYGWSPSTVIVYDFDERREDGWGAIHAQILLIYGAGNEWSMRLEPMAPWSDEELELADSHITLHKEANGFVTVRTTRPFGHYSRDPAQAPLAEDFRVQAPWIYVDDILGLSATGQCLNDPAYPFPIRDAHSITWCDEDAGVTIAFTVPEEYHDEILDNVDVRLVTAGPGG